MAQVHKVGWSMDQIHEVVYGPGPHGWSMDLGPRFVYVPVEGHWKCPMGRGVLKVKILEAKYEA